jgi:hypothetical protein
MQKDERYQIIKPYFILNDVNIDKYIIDIKDVKECKEICSCRDSDDCDNKVIIFTLISSSNTDSFYECIRELKKVVKPVLLKPNNMIEFNL